MCATHNYVANKKPKVYAPDYVDRVEVGLGAGKSINDLARALGVSAHVVQKCIRMRPHLAPLAARNGLKKRNMLKEEAHG